MDVPCVSEVGIVVLQSDEGGVLGCGVHSVIKLKSLDDVKLLTVGLLKVLIVRLLLIFLDFDIKDR